MRANTFRERRRLYLLARVIVVRHYRRELTLATVARALCCSSRQLQRAYAQFGKTTFHEDLVARRMAVAAELLAEPTIPTREVMRLVGYRSRPHFTVTFRRRYGLSPARFRREALGHRALAPALAAGRPFGAGGPPAGAGRVAAGAGEPPAGVGRLAAGHRVCRDGP